MDENRNFVNKKPLVSLLFVNSVSQLLNTVIKFLLFIIPRFTKDINFKQCISAFKFEEYHHTMPLCNFNYNDMIWTHSTECRYFKIQKITVLWRLCRIFYFSFDSFVESQGDLCNHDMFPDIVNSAFRGLLSWRSLGELTYVSYRCLESINFV